jgi:hypothetical protein
MHTGHVIGAEIFPGSSTLVSELTTSAWVSFGLDLVMRLAFVLTPFYKYFDNNLSHIMMLEKN